MMWILALRGSLDGKAFSGKVRHCEKEASGPVEVFYGEPTTKKVWMTRPVYKRVLVNP
jgi:hypothetical protein